jgi:hypothetical protein
MISIDTILNELKKVPADRMDELYAMIHSFRINTKKTENLCEKILSFSGSLADMSETDFKDFERHTRETRNDILI